MSRPAGSGTWAGVFLLLAGVLAEVLVRPAYAQEAVDQAEAEIRQGTELRHQNQDARALPHFERAYQLSRNPRTAAQLGLVKMALGYCVDAERLLDEALAVPDHPWISRNAGALEKTRANARRNIGQVSVAGSPAGAQILVNGHPVGALPLAAPLRLDRGPVEIEVRAAGYTSFARSLNIAAGAREALVVALVASAADVAARAAPATTAPPPTTATPSIATSLAPPPVSVATAVAASPKLAPVPPADPYGRVAPPAPSPSPSLGAWSGLSADVAGPVDAPAPRPVSDTSGADGASPSLKPLAFTAAGLAGAGLILGIVETVISSRRAHDFNNHTAASPITADPDRRVPDCETIQLNDECRSIGAAHDRARTLAIVAYIGAGASALTSAVLFVLATDRRGPVSSGVASTRLTCAPTLVAAGLSCRLAF